MFIGSVRLRNSMTGCVMREVVFHKGANLISDTFESDRHNKVGKTTFLKLIDVLLGASGKVGLYKDDETNSVNEELRDIINEKRVVGEMTLVNSFERLSDHNVELKVELFPGVSISSMARRLVQNNTGSCWVKPYLRLVLTSPRSVSSSNPSFVFP